MTDIVSFHLDLSNQLIYNKIENIKLDYNKNIQSVNLSHNCLYGQNLINILNRLDNYPNLTEIDLSWNNFNNDCYKFIYEWINQRKIKKLILKMNSIKENDISYFNNCIELNSINLEDCLINDITCDTYLQNFDLNNNLKELYIGNNYINHSLNSLLYSINNYTHLTHLSLYKTNFNSNNILYLCNIIKNKSLIYLDLGGNLFSNENLSLIYDSIRINNNIKILKFNKMVNNLTNKINTILLTSVIDLDISNNRFTNNLESFFKVLEHNTTLVTLNLNHCLFNIEFLMESLLFNNYLTNISIDNSQMLIDYNYHLILDNMLNLNKEYKIPFKIINYHIYPTIFKNKMIATIISLLQIIPIEIFILLFNDMRVFYLIYRKFTLI